MMTKTSLCVAAFAMIASVASAGDWDTLTPMPDTRMGLHAETSGGEVIVIGGQPIPSETGEPVADVNALDVASGEWRTLAPMPTARGFMGTALVDRRIYVIGGSLAMAERDPGVATVEIYDIASDSWSDGAPLGVARADLSASVLDGKIYAIGGTAHVAIDALGTVEMFDPATGVWSRRNDMPTPRLHFVSVAYDGRIYIFGGGPEWPVPLASVEIYDPATDTWSKGADMPKPRIGLWGAEVGGKIYVAGGLSWENEALSSVDVYDPATDSWDSIPDMPTARFLAATVGINGRLVVIGGSRTDYSTMDVVEAYTPN